jgi:hypothetical protein
MFCALYIGVLSCDAKDVHGTRRKEEKRVREPNTNFLLHYVLLKKER